MKRSELAFGGADRNRAWREALESAAGLPAAPGPVRALFQEEREDLRVVAGLDGVFDVVHTRLAGLSAVGTDPSRESFVSDPVPDDAAAVVLGLQLPQRGRGEAREPGPAPALDPSGAREAVEVLLAQARRAWGGGPLRAGARWVSFLQSVRVVGAGIPLCEDERRGARIRLEIRGPMGQSAVVEKALRPGEAVDAERMCSAAVGRAREREGAVRASPGEVVAVFASGAGGVLLHELIGHALEADTVESGESLLAPAGRRVGPPGLTVLDDPALGRAPWRWDDEGVEARRVCLVEEGRVAGLVHDRGTAGRAGVEPNGHGRRSSFQQRVRPRIGCTFLAPGRLDPAEVLEGLSRGIHVRRIETASVDTGRGLATFRVTDGDSIVNGRVETPLLPFLIEVPTLAALSMLDRVAADLAFDTCVGSCLRDGQPLATSVGAPTFRTGLVRVVP